MKIVLGTAQFGLDYGISNKRGRMPEAEAFSVLEEAETAGIDTLDTAYAYGDSEKVIGAFTDKTKTKFKIISKLPTCGVVNADNYLNDTLSRLRTKSLYGYILHDYKSYCDNPDLIGWLIEKKDSGIIEKIGFSLYYTQELERILESDIVFDIIQVPYSVFDRRFEKYFTELKQRGVEIYIRSVFLQGIVFKKLKDFNESLKGLKNKVARLTELSLQEKIPIYSICLNYALMNVLIDRVVVGVDGLSNLKELLLSGCQLDIFKKMTAVLNELKEDDENLVLPNRWKVKV